MCGFAGIVDFSNSVTEEKVKKAIDLIHHRGPDDEGIEIIRKDIYSIYFGFKRLAIIDLSTGGHQPMFSAEKDMVIVFNGEIYNFKRLKAELQKDGIKFTSESDTEVLIYLYKKYGISFVEHLNGMFAIVLYDIRREKIYLIRDRVGVKPLYYSKLTNGNLIFASELKSILRLNPSSNDIDYSAVYTYFYLGYIPAPATIFQSIKKVLPAHIIEYNLTSKEVKNFAYWTPIKNVYQYESFEDTADKLETLLKDAFKLRMVADVPVGVFLSGGYDSTAVTALLQTEMTSRLKTFTIGFDDEAYNEANHAEAVARHLGTDHTTITCKLTDAIELVPKIPFHFDEPFGDSSAVPTMLVSKLARQYVTVSLSADGGDELFAGYQRHLKAHQQLRKIVSIPPIIKKFIGEMTHLLPNEKNIFKYDLIWKINTYFSDNNTSKLFLNQLSVFSPYQIKIMLSKGVFFNPLQEIYLPEISNESLLNSILLTDFYTYLPEDILTKVDRATMSVSLEGREPFLDYRVVEYAFSLPDYFKINNQNIQKAILRHIVHKYVPKTIMDRPKMGFGIPIHKWLKNELKWMIDEHLNEDKLKRQGFFNPDVVKQSVQYFLKSDSKSRIDHQRIWFLLMFQMWFDRWIDTTH
ncbi:asparagine synthetase B [Thermaurantimonas aggregans]|uniref:asparagine synthase (glutamine-hydrolyzing) n=1 Tax=Thermaurantimonas aggregans TaxID=2173829 RepID=A0A401XNL1_9FLAO|nr:asparagine synthase (glutamine-hydrolyzing) [Thermaurantimonas aggregans]MCX8148455.1 asparagine synthase (glutamine-hydrolyzing) [Thermaurantimonas aggregans]GCD78590.1 asparagine synthetase B [Thermaurantimonas aggregans]